MANRKHYFQSFILLFVFFLTLTQSSCTIEKRRYLSGYNVQWHQNAKTKKDKIKAEPLAEREKPQETENEPSYEPTANVAADDLTERKVLLFPLTREKGASTQDVSGNDYFTDLALKTSIATNDSIREQEPSNSATGGKDDRRLNIVGLMSFIMALFSFLVFPALVALILGIIAKHQFSKYPEKYKGKWMAEAGFTIGLVIVTVVVVLVLLVIKIGGAS